MINRAIKLLSILSYILVTARTLQVKNDGLWNDETDQGDLFYSSIGILSFVLGVVFITNKKWPIRIIALFMLLFGLVVVSARYYFYVINPTEPL